MSKSEHIVARVLLVLAGAVVAGLLYVAFAAYSWGQFGMGDFATYTNMLWNTAHGEWFKCRIDDNYLINHLSFSLAVLAPLFLAWDHPFLLGIVQCALAAGGAAVLYAFGRRAGVPVAFRAAVVLFLVGYHITQSTLIAEFHGVAMYYLLVPWCLYAMTFSRSLLWLPMLLLLGLREDAALVVLPMLVHSARTERWRAGWWWAAAAAGYTVFAIGVLFPAINGVGLLYRRQRDLAMSPVDMGEHGYKYRVLRGLAWLVVPAAAVALRSWAPVLYPSLVWVQDILSANPDQQGLGCHYGGSAMVLLACGMMQGARAEVLRARAAGRAAGPWYARTLALGLVVMVSHAVWGYTLLGGRAAREHKSIEPSGLEAQAAAARIPRDGGLLADDDLVAFAGNRPDVINYKHFRPFQHPIRYVFVETARLDRRLKGRVLDLLRNGTLGVWSDEGRFLVLQRGGATQENARVLSDYQERQYIADTPGRHGDTRFDGGRQVRFWNGNGSRSPCDLSHGATWRLEPGAYEASLVYRARVPERAVRRSWGWVRIYELGREPPMREVDLAAEPTPAGGWSTQAVSFVVSRPMDVELRIVGADAGLSLHHWRMRPMGDGGPAPAR